MRCGLGGVIGGSLLLKFLSRGEFSLKVFKQSS
jgi:hypothetical protein